MSSLPPTETVIKTARENENIWTIVLESRLQFPGRQRGLVYHYTCGSEHYMKSVANAAGLDATEKKLTNHSLRKTTMRKLRKQGIPNSDIAAIARHRNVQSLQQYAEMEQKYHAQTRVSRVLSSGHQCAVTRPPLHDCNPNVPVTPSYATSIVPHQYNFSNCTVFFGNTQASSTSRQYQVPVVTPRKRPRAYIIDSDED